jgi:hypothetical protein
VPVVVAVSEPKRLVVVVVVENFSTWMLVELARIVFSHRVVDDALGGGGSGSRQDNGDGKSLNPGPRLQRLLGRCWWS